MTDDYCELSLIIDTREKNLKRIKAVSSKFEELGGCFETGALQLCDYKVSGLFRGKQISLGIEAKALTDLSKSYPELPDKLARAYQIYTDVALFVEEGPYNFSEDEDRCHATIRNPAVRDGGADVLKVAVYENLLESLQREGVHVRRLRSEAQWPYSLYGLLIYITKDIHDGLCISGKDYKSQYLNVLTKIPGIGMQRALKILPIAPNLMWLGQTYWEQYQEELGDKVGKGLHDFIHNSSLYTDEFRGGGAGLINKSAIAVNTPLTSQPPLTDKQRGGDSFNKRASFLVDSKPFSTVSPDISQSSDSKSKQEKAPNAISRSSVTGGGIASSTAEAGIHDNAQAGAGVTMLSRSPGHSNIGKPDSRDGRQDDESPMVTTPTSPSHSPADGFCGVGKEEEPPNHSIVTIPPTPIFVPGETEKPVLTHSLKPPITLSPQAGEVDKSKEKIIECKRCGLDSSCGYVNPETELCNPCQGEESFYESAIRLPNPHISHDEAEKVIDEAIERNAVLKIEKKVPQGKFKDLWPLPKHHHMYPPEKHPLSSTVIDNQEHATRLQEKQGDNPAPEWYAQGSLEDGILYYVKKHGPSMLSRIQDVFKPYSVDSVRGAIKNLESRVPAIVYFGWSRQHLDYLVSYIGVKEEKELDVGV